jgi:putative transposase
MTRRKFIIQLKQVFQSSQETVIQYLTQEIKFLLTHLARRPKPTQAERALLARAAKAVDPLYLEKTFNLFTPATLHRWYRELVRQKWDYSKKRKYPGRPKISPELEKLIVKLALENPHDGYQTLVGRLKLLGFQTNPETIQNILKRNGLSPSPERKGQLTWKKFLDIHWEDLAATDFLTWEVLTPFGWVTYYVLFFIRHLDRKVHVAGITKNPNESWMLQMARNLTDPETGFLKPGMKLLHDRDTKYTAHFARTLDESGVQTLKLPAKSPKLNAHAERFVRTVKEQCLSRIIIIGEEQLRKALKEYIEFYNDERCHQGLGNRIPSAEDQDGIFGKKGKIRQKQRLGGLLKVYFRDENTPKPSKHNDKTAA